MLSSATTTARGALASQSASRPAKAIRQDDTASAPMTVISAPMAAILSAFMA